jgi:hypothetical protein
MLIPLLALVLLRQTAIANSDPDDTGAVLVQNCRATIRVLDQRDSNNEVEIAKSLECIRYIEGFIDGVNILNRRVCVQGASKGTVARVYVAFMEKNPKYFDRPREVGLALALIDGYSCTKK